LREARETAGLSQRDLAFPGCSAAYISRLERGERTPSLQLVRELARRLDVSQEWLASGAEAEAQGALLLEAELALGLGELGAARRGFEAAIGSRPTRRDEGRALAGLAALALEEGRVDDARERVESARALVSNDADVPGLRETFVRAALASGETDSALAAAEAALAEAETERDTAARARLTTILATTLPPGPLRDTASTSLAGALPEGEQRLDPALLARRYRAASRRHAARGRLELATEYVRRALAVLAVRDDAQAVADGYRLLAATAFDRGDPVEAQRLLERALGFARQASPPTEATVRLELAELEADSRPGAAPVMLDRATTAG